MNYKDITINEIYMLDNARCKVLNKNAGWVSVEFPLCLTIRRVRAKDLTFIPFMENITAKCVYKKPSGVRMKINGFKYRVKHLKPGDTITDRCMYRSTSIDGNWKPAKNTIGEGREVFKDSFFEYIEILSPFYNP